MAGSSASAISRRHGDSGNTDRVLYLDNSGRANFAINDGSYRTVYSRGGINDGNWHHVVGTVDGAGHAALRRRHPGRPRSELHHPKSYSVTGGSAPTSTTGFTNKPTDAGLVGGRSTTSPSTRRR